MESNEIEAMLADPKVVGEAIKHALSGRNDFLDEVLVDFLRGYFKAKAALEMKNV